MAIEDIKRIANKLDFHESLNKSLDNVHITKLFSLVFNGTENGSLTRAFIAGKKIKPFDAQLHSHTYDLRITPIRGMVRHHVADMNSNAPDQMISLYEYKSPLNGGNGLKYLRDTSITVKDYIIPIGSSIALNSTDIHTISCGKGAIWIVEELGFKTDTSLVLGNPFTTEGLYSEPKQYQINDAHQLLKSEIGKIIINHELTVHAGK